MLNPDNVPDALRSIIPLAERFGVADDLERKKLIMSAMQAERNEISEAIRDHEDLLDAWLAGTEASGPFYSDEYIAFSALRMTADSIA